MRRHFHNQLMLDLRPGKRSLLPQTAPEELRQALADLLLEALGKHNNGVAVEREPCDASQNHA